ncbi:MAG: hypothetical protein GQ583_05225, partial [Methyloprofundus sp.]|nr:hypothetical protein [Methyloprofundus sp.]
IVSSVKNAFELPEHGTEKYIKSRYGVLLDELDNAAKEATTFFKFAATIEAIQLPEEVIYIGIVKDKERIDVIKNLTWNGHSLRTMNRYGAGTLSVNGDKVKIMTYETIPSPK